MDFQKRILTLKKRVDRWDNKYPNIGKFDNDSMGYNAAVKEWEIKHTEYYNKWENALKAWKKVLLLFPDMHSNFENLVALNNAQRNRLSRSELIILNRATKIVNQIKELSV
jgi:glutaredoxin 2